MSAGAVALRAKLRSAGHGLSAPPPPV